MFDPNVVFMFHASRISLGTLTVFLKKLTRAIILFTVEPTGVTVPKTETFVAEVDDVGNVPATYPIMVFIPPVAGKTS